MREIVFPNGNEEEFVDMAEKLGYSELFFVYDINKRGIEEKIKPLEKKTKIRLSVIYITKNSKHNIKNKTIIMESSSKNRHVIESKKTQAIFNLENQKREDFIHHRAAGLNQVLCKLAKEKNIIIGFSFRSILNSKERYKVIGRMVQNIKLCKKYKTDMVFASYAKKPYEMRGSKDIRILFFLLGFLY